LLITQDVLDTSTDADTRALPGFDSAPEVRSQPVLVRAANDGFHNRGFRRSENFKRRQSIGFPDEYINRMNLLSARGRVTATAEECSVKKLRKKKVGKCLVHTTNMVLSEGK
jgi:hypothetical protein